MERERDRQRQKSRQIFRIFLLYHIVFLLISNTTIFLQNHIQSCYFPFSAIPCISDEDKSVADAMGFSYDDVVDENYIVKSGQVNSRILKTYN